MDPLFFRGSFLTHGLEYASVVFILLLILGYNGTPLFLWTIGSPSRPSQRSWASPSECAIRKISWDTGKIW